MFCKLFGHKFVMTHWDRDAFEYLPKQLDFCVRCGATKEEVDNKFKKNWFKKKPKAQIIKKDLDIDELLK